MKNFDTNNCKKLIADLQYCKDTNYDLENNWINGISDLSKKQLDMLFSICSDKYSLVSLALDLINNKPIEINKLASNFDVEMIGHQLKFNCFTGFSN